MAMNRNKALGHPNGKPEVWKCGRFMNQRSDVLVMRINGKRYNCASDQWTTVSIMKADGWIQQKNSL